MDQDFAVAITCLVVAILFYTWLTWYNYKNIIRTKEERLKARREQRKRRRKLF